MRSLAEGFALVWVGVLLGALAVWAYEEIRFRHVLRRLLREAYGAVESVEESR